MLMLEPIRRILHNAYREFAPDHVLSGSALLPAKHLRLCGEGFKDDDYFLASAKGEADRLVKKTHLSSQSRILDLGCGVGRLPLGILAMGLEIESYLGLDVDDRSVRWCKKHIQAQHSKFRFLHTDVRSARYNPKGTALGSGFHWPFESRSFDVIYSYSVFSHMLTNDLQVYAREFKRVLALGGHIFVTAFVEDNVPDVVENPDDYKMRWNSVLHCVRYNTKFFIRQFEDVGLEVLELVHGMETDGQSALYLAHSRREP